MNGYYIPKDHMINFRIIARVIGLILICFGGFMLIPATWSLVMEEDIYDSIYYAGITCIIAGLAGYLVKPKANTIRKREGYLIVALGWIVLCIMGSLPYLFSSVLSNFSNAFFESTSGLTTTGATVFNHIEELPQGILLWRSLSQWIGGMGIIVLTVAIFPLLGVSGVELFVAEAPGPTSEKIHPRIKETAKRLWLIYLGLTATLCLILYFVSKMNFFDAINHALTTMATGGFSTKDASLAHFDTPIVQYPIICFMFLAGLNYTIIYFGLKGELKKIWLSDELRTYVFMVLTLVVVVSFIIFIKTDYSVEESFRVSALQIISIITTTGFVSADYTSWSTGLTMFFFILLFSGACAGSTSGGIKVIRHLALAKNTIYEFKRLLHQRALIRVKIDKSLVAHRVLTHILVFVLVYMFLFFSGSIIMSSILHTGDQPVLSSFGAVATCLGNVGPGIGSVGPEFNFSHIPLTGKNVLCLLMIIGRLELFTILVILTPFFWKVN